MLVVAHIIAFDGRLGHTSRRALLARRAVMDEKRAARQLPR
jgi:hypothetical protein